METSNGAISGPVKLVTAAIHYSSSERAKWQRQRRTARNCL